jgi:hypothetical protein
MKKRKQCSPPISIYTQWACLAPAIIMVNWDADRRWGWFHCGFPLSFLSYFPAYRTRACFLVIFLDPYLDVLSPNDGTSFVGRSCLGIGQFWLNVCKALFSHFYNSLESIRRIIA